MLEGAEINSDDQFRFDWSLFQSWFDYVRVFLSKEVLQVVVEGNLTQWIHAVLLNCKVILVDQLNQNVNKSCELLWSWCWLVSWILKSLGTCGYNNKVLSLSQCFKKHICKWIWMDNKQFTNGLSDNISNELILTLRLWNVKWHDLTDEWSQAFWLTDNDFS